ncbi:P-loop containing nucleoside triphosphate hydrolase protein [Crassisporium funariophilum]|nr:P-loop containing nucleoside triphosphate hydrolase protein [Crassisporium funariophilum]
MQTMEGDDKPKVHWYTEDEVDLDELAAKAYQIFGKWPFRWQLESALGILCGKDVILDVGTGSGKTLCFLLPLLLCETDIGMTVSPLSALMLEQAHSYPLATVAVCHETIEAVGKDKLYEVLVSPEIAISPNFHRHIFSKTSFTGHLLVINIDEAHCINIWGGSFRPDYAALGILQGKLPKDVPFEIASATLPDHVLDDIRGKLRLSKDTKTISVTNARPNVALSVRVMKHSDESKADLRFIIPFNTEAPKDIPITLVYCNRRDITEICVDRTRGWANDQGITGDCIAFYHAHIGSKRKRQLEEQLAKGEIRILYCTTALGMGCDLRNIAHVVMWGLPSSFCALVQEAGRAGRDLNTQGEAILIIPKSVLKQKASETNIINQEVAPAALEGESLERPITDHEFDDTREALDEEGIRVEDLDNFEPKIVEPPPRAATVASTRPKRHKWFGKETNIHEAQALLEFSQTEDCRRRVWDVFFNNNKKLGLIYSVTSMYQANPNTRCCDNCQLDSFPIEHITTSKVETGRKRGKKHKVPEEEIGYISKKLHHWRDNELMTRCYPGVTSLSAAILMSDDIIKQISSCGEQINSTKTRNKLK